MCVCMQLLSSEFSSSGHFSFTPWHCPVLAEVERTGVWLSSRPWAVQLRPSLALPPSPLPPSRLLAPIVQGTLTWPWIQVTTGYWQRLAKARKGGGVCVCVCAHFWVCVGVLVKALLALVTSIFSLQSYSPLLYEPYQCRLIQMKRFCPNMLCIMINRCNSKCHSLCLNYKWQLNSNDMLSVEISLSNVSVSCQVSSIVKSR